MSFLKTPKPPAPDPELKAAQERQEARLEDQEEQKMRQISARQRARRVGGQRMLLSMERDVPQTGIKTTLGS
jgi:hypothetical protein